MNWFSRWLGIAEQDSCEEIMLAFVQSGSPALLEQLIKLLGDDLYHFLLSHCDPTLAADICQSTWLKVMEKRQYYQDKGNFKAWLFTLGRNQMIDQMRQANRWQTLDIDGDDHISQCSNPGKKIEDTQQLALFNQTLSRLPFLQKEAFILQQEGFSLAEIANITGENAETIKSRLRYARNHLNQVFTPVNEEAS